MAGSGGIGVGVGVGVEIDVGARIGVGVGVGVMNGWDGRRRRKVLDGIRKGIWIALPVGWEGEERGGRRWTVQIVEEALKSGGNGFERVEIGNVGPSEGVPESDRGF